MKKDFMILSLDNGITGGYTVLASNGKLLAHGNTPVKHELSYTKKKQQITRVDTIMLEQLLKDFSDAFCYMERPMINPMRFKASISAARALEATLIVLERLGISYCYEDSKTWQKLLLPSGLNKDQLKKAANDIAKRLYPKVQIVNADSVLIAEYGRRQRK